MEPEIIVQPHVPLLKGYVFVPKGDLYRSRKCREHTLAAHKPFFIVQDEKKRRIGIRVPHHVLKQVALIERETASSRRAAVQKKDASLIMQANVELNKLYPDMPPDAAEKCLKVAFKKHSGRVGRTGSLELSQKVDMAVKAYVRHSETPYDVLLRTGVNREEARRQVTRKMDEVLKSWGGEGLWISKAVDFDKPVVSGKPSSSPTKSIDRKPLRRTQPKSAKRRHHLFGKGKSKMKKR
ncbi:hypothetical protein K402DRAFT_336371 [Aulographum hederae CBS 113979]|uniref:DUF2293 domain-containing protein n=1 Tax=Aulographum hederae CBS 113979 TaxID=1176131 RepID=A0A6G1GUI4_9PEZI|nr:hypothetical protein K402DRAFT_336371 [Aulographum hederae CBS 113979]